MAATQKSEEDAEERISSASDGYRRVAGGEIGRRTALRGHACPVQDARDLNLAAAPRTRRGCRQGAATILVADGAKLPKHEDNAQRALPSLGRQRHWGVCSVLAS